MQDCCTPRHKTHIMYNGNLSSAQTNAYLNLLISRELLSAEKGKYGTTEKGLQFLSAYDQVDSILRMPTQPIRERKNHQVLNASQPLIF